LLRNILIESYVPLCQYIAKKLAGRKWMEARNVGLLALTKAINNLPENLRNPNAYLGTYITREIKRFLILDTTIKVPVYGSATHRHLRSTFSITDHVAVKGEQDAVDLKEFLEQIPRNKNEEAILKCITEGGYSLQEMTSFCNVKEARVCQIKQDLQYRILARLRAVK
jgi:DNA-directed RNA polymerase specialized sigma subunit